MADQVQYEFGYNAKLYFCADTPITNYDTVSWTEMSNVKDVTVNMSVSEVDATTRANNGWKAIATVLFEGSLEFEMVWNTGDPGFAAILAAWAAKGLIGIAAFDQDKATVGALGLRMNALVASFVKSEPIENIQTVKVTLKPGYCQTAPEWKTIS